MLHLHAEHIRRIEELLLLYGHEHSDYEWVAADELKIPVPNFLKLCGYAKLNQEVGELFDDLDDIKDKLEKIKHENFARWCEGEADRLNKMSP